MEHPGGEVYGCPPSAATGTSKLVPTGSPMKVVQLTDGTTYFLFKFQLLSLYQTAPASATKLSDVLFQLEVDDL